MIGSCFFMRFADLFRILLAYSVDNAYLCLHLIGLNTSYTTKVTKQTIRQGGLLSLNKRSGPPVFVYKPSMKI